MGLIVPSRRGFLTGLTALLSAPSIVRATNLMPVSMAAEYAGVRELRSYDYCSDVWLVRYDTLFDGGQFGLDYQLSIGPFLPRKMRKSEHVNELIAGISNMTGKTVRLADLTAPAIPLGYRNSA